MQYFALLISKERDWTPDEKAAEMAAYQRFHTKAASAVRAGDALLPTATGARITGGPDSPIITDGPFAEAAEVACGYYVFEAENLDEALALARDIPAAKHGAVEVWPMAGQRLPTQSLEGADWIALLLEPPDHQLEPGSPEWQARWSSTSGSKPSAVVTYSRGPRCIHHRRRPRCACATARSWSPTGHTWRAPKLPTASMC
ncbi:hypothetical protein MLAC_35340 [Mycobacterium lacus]|uniref:YCII-related domain-containing protein n=1 Tax=Mycobacterium lacus TaxID=169765 RepID=A0A7I7NNZ8_9MYCO|nr:hypothetical protein MLAC_35340 [Mycobacterium lacus]